MSQFCGLHCCGNQYRFGLVQAQPLLGRPALGEGFNFAIIQHRWNFPCQTEKACQCERVMVDRPVNPHVLEARSLLMLNRFAEAVAAAEAGLAIDAKDPNLHLMKAESLRMLGHFAQAALAADAGLAIDPNRGALHLVKADTLFRLEHFAASLAAADQGLAIDPKDAGLHFMKADSLRTLFRFAESLAAAETGLAADPTDANLHFVKAESLRNLGRLAEAVATAGAPAGASLSRPSDGSGSSPSDPQSEAPRKAALGDALMRQGQAIEALQAYREAIQLQPNEPRYHVKFAMAAWQLGQMDVVEHHALHALRLAPDCAEVQDLLARWHDDRGELEQALMHSDRAIRLAPDDPQIAVTRAWVLQASGQLAAAWQLIEPLVAAGLPSTPLGVLYGRMAPQLKRETEALAFLERLLASPEIASPFKAPVYLAAATLLDRAGAHDRAFEHMRLGKQANRWPHDRQAFTRWTDLQIGYFTPGKLHSLPRASHRSRRPVFIIGMPRSGTSLVEQILASHPQVHGAGELPTLGEIMASLPLTNWANGKTYPGCLDSLGAAEADQLAAAYLSTISAINDQARYVTDKMPTNFVLLGLIATLFPECHVIHCTRDPLDTCLSCYMTDFVLGQPFTHDLTDLGAFYRDYHRLMVHWKTVLRYPMIEVNYEQLVGDMENQTRRLLTLLDLPWDARCLRYYENKRVVRTASRYQVRQPIYSSSIGRWKHYEKHLSELISAMGPARRQP